MIIINPGTERQENTTEANAIESAKRFCRALKVEGLRLTRNSKADDDRGWYGFTLHAGDRSVSVDVPGIAPDITEKGEPWVSPRLYVDGSSWLWGYALGIAADRLTKKDL